ncbi:MAG: FAD-binding protein [Nodosilinea sp.]
MKTLHNLVSNSLSFYRTEHYFEYYAEFNTIQQFCEYVDFAKTANRKIYILGNGSNTFFLKRRVRSLVLKNKLKPDIVPISTSDSGARIRATSSTLVIDVLKYCFENSLDSFYYLASVPATIGGALAMNAGRGQKFNLTIYDFVESVDFFDCAQNCIITLGTEDIVRGYRETIFSGVQSLLITSAIFNFPVASLSKNPIAERCKWSKANQDYTGSNCGSVFKQADAKILESLKGLRVGESSFSAKTSNWIVNKSSHPFSIIFLIYIAQIIHFIKRKKSQLEIIVVR